MMKTLILLIFLFSTTAWAQKTKGRKVSNSIYFSCMIERDNIDGRVFKEEYHFPFPMEKGEIYELKDSMRWNDFKIVFAHNGKVKIELSENVQGNKLTTKKDYDMGKHPEIAVMKVKLELKAEGIVIPYIIHCAPE